MIDAAVAPTVTNPRWVATVFYRTEIGSIDVTHDLVEIEDLQHLVERGPHWDTVVRVSIVRADGADRALTVEEAAKL